MEGCGCVIVAVHGGAGAAGVAAMVMVVMAWGF